MENFSKLKLNLVGLGKISSEIVEKMYDPDDCIKHVFPENIAGEDLESNEIEFKDSVNEQEIEQTFCFVDGNKGIAGICLKLLTFFNQKPITIFYIKQEYDSNVEKINHKISFNILQEYARSGQFTSLFVFDYEKMWNFFIGNMLANDGDNTYDYNDVQNLVIDKIIYGAHIYWRLLSEKYLDGSSVNFDSTIYKIHTFCEPKNHQIDEANIFGETFYNLRYSISSILISSLKKKINKKDLQTIVSLKRIAKNTNSKLIILNNENDEDVDLVISILSTNIIQESNYIID